MCVCVCESVCVCVSGKHSQKTQGVFRNVSKDLGMLRSVLRGSRDVNQCLGMFRRGYKSVL